MSATLALFWRYVRCYPLRLAGLLVGIPLAVFGTRFIAPLIAAGILNKIAARDFTPGDLWGSFGPQLIWYTVAVAAGGIVPWRWVVFCVWSLEIRVLRDMARNTFDHLLRLSANFHANTFGGTLVSQAGKLQSAYVRIADTTTFGLLPLVWTIIFTAVLLWPDAPLFVVALLLLCVVFAGVGVAATRWFRRRAAIEAAVESEQTGYLADAITNVLTVKSFAAGDAERARYALATQRTAEKQSSLMRLVIANEIGFSVVFSSITALAMVMAAAGVTLWDLPVGTVFLMAVYTGHVVEGLWEFSIDSLRNYSRAFGDARDMTVILGSEPTVAEPDQPQLVRISHGAIKFERLTFAHDDSGEALFADFDLAIGAREKVGLVGHSGSGKTTLTTLLLRLADIGGGAITIDGQNIAGIRQDDLRSHIAYVPQEPLLFHRTIAENIGYGRPGATQDEIADAAAKAHAAEFIERLPQGYDTLVGERGIKLSGGQRQRIAIARAMLKQAPILLLDEATSALDSESERLIQDSLGDLMADRTTLVIAHRLSTIQRMDRIVVLDRGRIAEQGSHAELLGTGGIYASLWAHQSGGFLED